MDDNSQIEEIAYLRNEVKRLRKALNKLSPGINMLLKLRGFSVYTKEEEIRPPAMFFNNALRCR